MQRNLWQKAGVLWLMLALFSACTRPQGQNDANAETSPTTRRTAGGSRSCAQWPPTLDLDWQAAAALPTLDTQGRLQRTEPGRHPWLDQVARQGVCQTPLPPASATRLEQARALIEAGQPEQALPLLETLLYNPLGRSPGRYGLAAPVVRPVADLTKEQVRQAVHTLLEAAAVADLAGDPDWERYLREAQAIYRDYITTHLDDSQDVREAMVVASEIVWLLDNEALFQEAWDRVVTLAEQVLREKTAAFDPCTAEREQIRDLLRSAQGAAMVGVSMEAPSIQNALQKAAMAVQRDGRDASLIMTDPPAPLCASQITWEHTYAGGMTVVGEAHTCDGTTWEGTFQVSGSIQGRALFSEGSLAWQAEPGETAETRAPSSGTLKGPGFSAPFTDDLYFRFTLSENTLSAELLLTSDGNGTITLPGVGAENFASVFPGEPVTVSPQPYILCEKTP